MSALTLDIVSPSNSGQSFKWTEERSQAAVVLAAGGTRQEAADDVGVSRSTIYEWLQYPEFCAEVDRLSVMVGIASRAERLRVAMRLVRSRINEETGAVQSDKDVLDWLKFAQSETDGAKIDLSKLAELLSGGQGAQAQDAVGSGGGERNMLSSSSAAAIETTATGITASLATEHTQQGSSPSASSSQSDELDFNPS